MTSPDRPVQLVLDSSAIALFVAGGLAVGELIAEIDDEGGAVGLPVLCLAQASRQVADRDALHLLVNHHATVVLAVHPEGWAALATTAHEIVGQVSAASAVIAAVEHDCDVLTAVPRLYAGLDGDMILPIDQ